MLERFSFLFVEIASGENVGQERLAVIRRRRLRTALLHANKAPGALSARSSKHIGVAHEGRAAQVVFIGGALSKGTGRPHMPRQRIWADVKQRSPPPVIHRAVRRACRPIHLSVMWEGAASERRRRVGKRRQC